VATPERPRRRPQVLAGEPPAGRWQADWVWIEVCGFHLHEPCLERPDPYEKDPLRDRNHVERDRVEGRDRAGYAAPHLVLWPASPDVKYRFS